MVQNKDFQNTSTTIIALMQWFETANKSANADLSKHPAFTTEVHRREFGGSITTTKTLKNAARDWYCLPKTVNDTMNQTMSLFTTSIEASKKQD